MSDDLVKRLRDPLLGYPDCFHQAAADRIEAQAAEITRLRAELATARRDAMEEPAQRLEELHKAPLRGRGSDGKTHSPQNPSARSI